MLETTLNYILFNYHKQIDDNQRKKILAETSQEKRWNSLIEISFRDKYLNKKASKSLDLVDLGHTNYKRYKLLKQILENEITIFIGIRNKLAHGQWAIALNNEGTDKVQETTSKIWTLTKKECMYVKNIVDNFSALIEMLVASKTNFEKCYDIYIHKIEYTKRLQTNSYDWIISEMKRKYKKIGKK